MSRFRNYAEVLAADGDQAPEAFHRHPGVDDAPLQVPVAVYTDRAYHEVEKQRLWSRTWQMACREEHVPEPGDQYVYDVVDRSYLIVRGGDGRLRAFVNACLHRGRRLREYPGRAATIRCPFHAFTWDLEGRIRGIPSRAEFDRHDDTDWQLPAVSVGTWGGFVFINPDPSAGPLSDYLGELPEHFDRWALQDRCVTTHVVKLLRCNWKIAQEAFMETYHAHATHPQSAWGSGDGELSQYDAFGHFSRAITPRAIPSPHLAGRVPEQRILDGLMTRLSRGEHLAISPGETARATYARHQRRELERSIGRERAAALSTAELCDLLYYTVFPNFHPWGAYYQSVYRFLPNGDDHRSSRMEFMLLSPFEGSRPAPADVVTLGFDDSWTAAVGPRGRIFDQDSLNMPEVQRGLETTTQRTVRLAEHQEVKIRHFYKCYAKLAGIPID